MNTYIVCPECKVGTRDDEEGANTKLFYYGHAGHGPIELVAEVEFLSKFLSEGFVDTDRPALTPLPIIRAAAITPGFTTGPDTIIVSGPGRAMPFGKPMDRSELLAAQRAMNVEYRLIPAAARPERIVISRWATFHGRVREFVRQTLRTMIEKI